VFGILVAYFSNYLIDLSDLPGAWRWMLGMEAIPALIYTLLVFKVPESPRWLIAHKDDFEKAREILEKTDPDGVNEAIDLALEEKRFIRVKIGFSALFNTKYLHITFLAVLIALFNQLS